MRVKVDQSKRRRGGGGGGGGGGGSRTTENCSEGVVDVREDMVVILADRQADGRWIEVDVRV